MKTVLITGVSKGIGAALARKFLAEGFDVLGTVYTGSAAEAHEHLSTFNLDLASPESIAACTSEIIATSKKLDIMINCAGVLLDEDETTVVPELLRKTLAVNVVGVTNFTEQLLGAMSPEGHIVNISSTAGSLELEKDAEGHFPYHYPAYKISKAALNMYTRTLAVRLKKDTSIIVSSVHPGWVKTDMGGAEADVTPDEAAEGIYGVAVSRPETGQFWFRDKKLPW